MVYAVYIPYIYGIVLCIVYGMVLLCRFLLLVVTKVVYSLYSICILMFYSRARHTNVCRFCS